jgi:hypothetical protein
MENSRPGLQAKASALHLLLSEAAKQGVNHPIFYAAGL